MTGKFVCGDWNLKKGTDYFYHLLFYSKLIPNLVIFFPFRLRSARILLCGLNGLGAEVAKNLILAGIKSITLLDHRNVTAADICSQFLAPQTALNENRAEASLLRAQALNPIVEISVDKENLEKKSKEYFKNFDVVIVTEAPVKVQIEVNNACREQGVKFFCGDVWGMFGYSFADLQKHTFVE